MEVNGVRPVQLMPTSHTLVCGSVHHSRPSKRHRTDVSERCVQKQRIYGPDEPFVLLSHVERWWEDVRGALQKAECAIELRSKHLKEVETSLLARTHAVRHREEAVTQQEASLAALMPRLQAVARMESAMVSMISAAPYQVKDDVQTVDPESNQSCQEHCGNGANGVDGQIKRINLPDPAAPLTVPLKRPGPWTEGWAMAKESDTFRRRSVGRQSSGLTAERQKGSRRDSKGLYSPQHQPAKPPVSANLVRRFSNFSNITGATGQPQGSWEYAGSASALQIKPKHKSSVQLSVHVEQFDNNSSARGLPTVSMSDHDHSAEISPQQQGISTTSPAYEMQRSSEHIRSNVSAPLTAGHGDYGTAQVCGSDGESDSQPDTSQTMASSYRSSREGGGDDGRSDATVAHINGEMRSVEHLQCRQQTSWSWPAVMNVASAQVLPGCLLPPLALNLKLDLEEAAADALFLGLTSTPAVWGREEQRAEVASPMLNTASLQHLAALCATVDEVTSPGVHLLHISGRSPNPATHGPEISKHGSLLTPRGRFSVAESLCPIIQDRKHSAEVAASGFGRGSPAGSNDSGDDCMMLRYKNIQVNGFGGKAASELLHPLSYSKTLDYKSCQTIMCLTKDMARQLLPIIAPSDCLTGTSCQLPVSITDEVGRVWPMTYRCVPHRYSYELRSGWKPFAAAWGIGAGDTIVLERHTTDRSRLHARVMQPLNRTASSPARRAAAAAQKARNLALMQVVEQEAVSQHLNI